MGYLLVFILLLTPKTLFAQEYFSINVDNDLFFLTDHYYSSGIFLQYGKQLKGNDSLAKKYVLWELAQEIYTPNDNFTADSKSFDYPYGGWSYFKLTFQREQTEQKQTQWGLQLGITGAASGAEWMQNNYHHYVLGIPESIWTDEVPEAFHLNFFTDSFNQWLYSDKVSLQSHIFTIIGTQKIAAGGAIGFSLGKQSVLNKGGNILLDSQNGNGLYFGLRMNFTAHDYMISGSLFNTKARFTVPVNRLRAKIEAGYAIHKNDWRISVMYNMQSPDNKTQPQEVHHYLNITLSSFLGSLIAK